MIIEMIRTRGSGMFTQSDDAITNAIKSLFESQIV